MRYINVRPTYLLTYFDSNDTKTCNRNQSENSDELNASSARSVNNGTLNTRVPKRPSNGIIGYTRTV